MSMTYQFEQAVTRALFRAAPGDPATLVDGLFALADAIREAGNERAEALIRGMSDGVRAAMKDIAKGAE